MPSCFLTKLSFNKIVKIKTKLEAIFGPEASTNQKGY